MVLMSSRQGEDATNVPEVIHAQNSCVPLPNAGCLFSLLQFIGGSNSREELASLQKYKTG
jgi:hypothetical protein